MNIGIVTTWFERGAAYVSKQFEQVLETEHNVFIYARGGEETGEGDPNWDKENVTWGKKVTSPFEVTLIHKKDFKKWIDKNSIDIILFNEQHWFEPLLWCNKWKIKTVAYVDYYTELTVPLFKVYDLLICNTKRHFSVFEELGNAVYLPWGTDVDLFNNNNNNLVKENEVTFFHSCGMGANRKGTGLLLKAFSETKNAKKMIIHTQKPFENEEWMSMIDKLVEGGRLQIIEKTVTAPGLYHLGDVYVYPTLIEGIGLTIVEAISCGLATIVPNNGPMNEFVVNNDNGFLINIKKCYSRWDGYYWPKCEVEVKDLTEKIDYLARNPELVIRMKDKSRKHAELNLSFIYNTKGLSNLFINLVYTKINNKLFNEVISYHKRGFGKFNNTFISVKNLFNW